MHKEAMAQMTKILDAHQPEGKVNLLDCGSFDVNGNYRDMVVRRGWKYIGIDIAPGKNVDIVSEDPYRFPFENNAFDVVISGSTMEHVKAIWLWVPELVRVLKPGGLLAIITHTYWAYHPHPVDCWRIMPDGMKYLFDLTGQLEQYDIQMYCPTDISGVARKRML
jgi:SAM-dependent methyltransferase